MPSLKDVIQVTALHHTSCPHKHKHTPNGACSSHLGGAHCCHGTSCSKKHIYLKSENPEGKRQPGLAHSQIRGAVALAVCHMDTSEQALPGGVLVDDVSHWHTSVQCRGMCLHATYAMFHKNVVRIATMHVHIPLSQARQFLTSLPCAPAAACRSSYSH